MRAPLAVRTALRVHRALTRLLPRRIRREYGGDMALTFRAAVEAAAARAGTAGVVRVLVREIADLVVARRANRPAPLTRADDGAARPGHWHFGPDASGWRQSWRALRRRPAYLVASLVTIGAGTGAVTTVFALVDTVLIKSLPYPAAGALVTVYESSPSSRERTSLIAPARLEDWQRRTRAFVAIAGIYSESVTDTSGEAPERLAGLRVTPQFFDVFATAPLAGRTFTADEERAGGPGAVVISAGFWTRRFGRDPGAIGRALTIGGRAHIIVGVMPASFLSAVTDVWLPAQFAPAMLSFRDARFLNGVGRLRPGLATEDGQRDLAGVQAALAKEFPSTDAGWSVEVQSLKQSRIGDAAGGLAMLAGAVAALWLIALSNAAALTLVHVQRRTRELTIRAALGASRRGMLAVLLREAVIVATLGGLIGLAVATWSVPALRTVLTSTPRIDELVFDARAIAAAAGSLLLSVLVVALVPALAVTRRQRIAGASLGSRTVAHGPRRSQRALVVAQVALSVVLVGSAALLARSYFAVAAAPLGFDPSGVVTFHVAARWSEDRVRIGQLQQALLARLRELPHVTAAGMTNFLPATGATLRYQVRVDGVAGTNADGTITMGARMIASSYLETIGASLLTGESCAPDMSASGTLQRALVNRRFVEQHAGGRSPIGRTLRVVQGGNPLTIAGVVDDIAEDGPGTTPAPYFYACSPPGGWPDPNYVVRTANPAALPADLRRIVGDLDPERAIFGLRPLEDVLAESYERPRFDAASVALFATTAVALAALGLYGLFSLVVADRARDIAVRFALGASPRDVRRDVLGGAGRLIASGAGLGVVLALTIDRLIRHALFDLPRFDPFALGIAVVVLGSVSLLAVLVPASRASRIDPLVALRSE